MYSTSRSYFSYLCASVTSRICLSISPSLSFSFSLSPCLCFLPALPHRPVSKSNQKAGESHELSPRRRIPFVELSNYRRVQTPDTRTKGSLYTFIFHSFFIFFTIPNNFEARESLTCLFYCVRWRARLLFCIFFSLSVTEGVVPNEG